MKEKGKLIVIDGTDGCGKATQVALIKERLLNEGYDVETIDFPRYYDNFFGKLIGECLAGKHGDFLAVHPKIASILYAADRWESSSLILDWLNQGKTVIIDRYVSSSQIHQGGKIHDDNYRKEFLDWLDELEHGTFRIPRPDLIVYLDVPIDITLKLLKEKDQHIKKKYLEGKGDQAESNPEHLASAREIGIKMLQDEKWKRIMCANDKNELLSREEINALIYEEVKNLIKK